MSTAVESPEIVTDKQLAYALAELVARRSRLEPGTSVTLMVGEDASGTPTVFGIVWRNAEVAAQHVARREEA